jgi:hypothetical protein
MWHSLIGMKLCKKHPRATVLEDSFLTACVYGYANLTKHLTSAPFYFLFPWQNLLVIMLFIGGGVSAVSNELRLRWGMG